MRIVIASALVVALLAGAWFVKGSSVFTTAYQARQIGAPATVGTWVSIGPAPMSVLSRRDNPDSFNSGLASAIAVDPSNPNHWLIGAGSGGVWESVNGGSSWLPITDTAPTLATGSVAFASSDPRIIYVGTGHSAGTGNGKVGVGVLKSTDGGRTWLVLGASSFARTSVRRMRVDPANANIVVAATTRGGYGRDSQIGAPMAPPFGVQKSTDGGVSWVRTLTGQATGLEIDATNFNNQYAAIGDEFDGMPGEAPGRVADGLYRSVDGGNSWSRVGGPWDATAFPGIGRLELAMSRSSPSVVYASIDAAPETGISNDLKGLYRTDNAWAPNPTWIQIPVQAVGVNGYCGPYKCRYSHDISVDPANPNTLIAGGAERGFWRCTNCGASPTWTTITANSNVHPDLHAMAWAGSRLLVATDGGVWSTTDNGVSWQNHNAGLSTALFISGALHPTDRNFILGGVRDFTPLLPTGNDQWSSLLQIVPNREWGEAEVAISSRNPATHWMLAWVAGDIQRTTDGGVTGIPADAGIDKTGAGPLTQVRKCPNDDDVFLTGTNRLWRTNNFFSAPTPSWTANSPPHPYPAPGTLDAPGTIFAIGFPPSESGCATYAYGNRGGETYLTQNGGVTWSNWDPARSLPARPINSIVFDPTTSTVAYVAVSSFDNATPGKPGHVFKTINALAATPTWTNVSPAADVAFNVLRIDPRKPNLIYAGSDTGLWQSTDAGVTWSKQGLDVGIPNVPVYDIQINPVTDTTMVFTYGRGAYRLVTIATNVHQPTNLRIDSVQGNSVTVSFKPPFDGLTPTGYVLEGGATPGQALAMLPINVGASKVTFAAPTGAFYVRIHALAGALKSSASNEVRLFVNVSAPPAAPTNLLYLVDGNTLSLAWMNSASGGALTANMIVVQGTINTGVSLPVTESFTAPTVPAGTYSLWVHGVSSAGDGPNSNGLLSVVVPGPCTGIPGAPANLNAAKSGNTISLTWDLPIAGPAPTSFVVNVTGGYVGSFPTTTRSLSGSVGPGAYTITVSSRNSCGSSVPTSPQTVVVP